MKSRERVERATDFPEAGRVPIDSVGLKASGIAVETYRGVMRQLNVDGMPPGAYVCGSMPLLAAARVAGTPLQSVVTIN